ncbi:MAG: glycine cleavage T C-terminal barrel domain-containing protein, partial [Planctomycetota bacterium]
SNVWQNGTRVGETTSGAWGYRVGKSIALGMVRADLSAPGTQLEIEIFGERVPAEVQPDQPLWDPDNIRLRS